MAAIVYVFVFDQSKAARLINDHYQGDVDQELRTDNTAALYARDSILLDNKVPFQRYRNSRIQADVMKTYRGLDLGRCLDKCLHLTERR